MYISGGLHGKEWKRKNQSYYNKACLVTFLCVPIAFLLSFAGYFLPNEVETFWEMRPFMPPVVFAVLCMVWAVGILCLKIINHSYIEKVRKYAGDCDAKKLFLDEFSVGDNLVFILTAKGLPYQWAVNYTDEVLRERQLIHCKERKAEMLSDGERMEINEIREEFFS